MADRVRGDARSFESLSNPEISGFRIWIHGILGRTRSRTKPGSAWKTESVSMIMVNLSRLNIYLMCLGRPVPKAGP